MSKFTCEGQEETLGQTELVWEQDEACWRPREWHLQKVRRERIGHLFSKHWRGRVWGKGSLCSASEGTLQAVFSMCHSFSKYVPGTCDTSGNKGENYPLPLWSFYSSGEARCIASGFENGPEAGAAQMVTVSAFASVIEPNQRLFDNNNLAVISSCGLVTADRCTVNSVYLQGKLEVTCSLYLWSLTSCQVLG